MSGYFGFLNCQEEEFAMSKMQDRWGTQTKGFGFTGVPNLLLRINALDETKGCERVSSAEMFVLLVILGHWV